MDKAEFDKFADEYYALHAANIAITGESPEYFADYKVKDLWRVAPTSCAKPPRILDFGAGTGTSVRSFKRYFSDAALTCLDVSAKSLEVGTKRFSGQANFVSFEGEKIPFEDAYFDIAFAACVFHHIAHWEHVGIMRELRRVLAPGGIIFIFEHNPYNPLTVRAVNTCPFDENAKLITALARQQSRIGRLFENLHLLPSFFPSGSEMAKTAGNIFDLAASRRAVLRAGSKVT